MTDQLIDILLQKPVPEHAVRNHSNKCTWHILGRVMIIIQQLSRGLGHQVFLGTGHGLDAMLAWIKTIPLLESGRGC